MPRKPSDKELAPQGAVAVMDPLEREAEPVPMRTLEPEDQEITLRPPRQERSDPTMWAVEARVVYLGNHPSKNVYLRGSVREIADPSRPGGKLYLPSTEGATSYDFAAVDTNGLPIRERQTRKEGKPWHVVRHIGHLAWFLRHEGADDAPEFSVRATPEVAHRIERFVRMELERERRDVDRGRLGLA
jgi:hypothetical protein